MLKRLSLPSCPAPIVAVLALHLVVVAWIVPLSGDAILGDDWDFSASVFNWNGSGYLTLSDYPSMTLIGHLVWGKMFTMALGSNQVALRISTVAMAWIGAISLYRTGRRQGATPSFSAALSAMFLFNPVVFFYSYFFVTDVTGCTLTLLFIAVVVPKLSSLVHLDQGTRLWIWVIIGWFTAFCYLTRETALIPAIISVGWFLPSVFRRTFDWKPALIAIVSASIPVLAIWYWITYWHGQPYEYEKSFVQFSPLANPKLVTVKTLRIALTLGFFLSPYTLAWLIRWLHFGDSRSRRRGLACATLGLCLAMLVMFAPRADEVCLYWGTNSIDSNVGSYLAVGGLRESLIPSEVRVGPFRTNSFELVVLPIASVSVLVLLALVWSKRRAVARICANWWKGESPSITGISFLSALGHAGLLILIWILFERYFAPLFTLSLVLLITPWQTQKSATKDRDESNCLRQSMLPTVFPTVILWLGILAMGAYSVIWTHDTRARHEAAWDAAARLVEKGVVPAEIGLGLFHQGAFVYRPAIEELTQGERRWLREVPMEDRRAAWNRAVPIRYRIRVMHSDETSPETLEVITPKTWIPGPAWELYRDQDLGMNE